MSRVFAIILLLAIGGASCKQEKTDRSPLLEAALSERLEAFRQTQERFCKEKSLEKAVKVVDSILVARARLEKDSLDKPPRPTRPERPALQSPLDSSPVRPLLPAEVDSGSGDG